MTTLGEDLPRVMTHVRDTLIPQYQSIGPAGGFAIMLMRKALDEAQRAMAEGDTVAMLRAYKELVGFRS